MKEEEFCPFLSIIVPVYNVEKYIRKCIDSLINQSFSNIEIIIIDDGSPDKCGDICDKYASNDNRIMVVHQENKGLCSARNVGISLAKGKWISFVDSDDWCDADYYENMISELGKNDADIYIAGGHIDEYPKKSVKTRNFNVAQQFITKDDMNYLMARVLGSKFARSNGIDLGTLGAPWDKLYRMKFLHSSGLLFDEGLKGWEDSLFNFQAFAKAEKITAGTCLGYHYRQVGTSITKGYSPNRLEINDKYFQGINSCINLRGCDDEILMDALNVRMYGLFNFLVSKYYFHTLYPGTKKEAIEEVNKVKEVSYYKEAIEKVKPKYLSWKQKMLLVVLRSNQIWMAYYLFRAKNKMAVC